MYIKIRLLSAAVGTILSISSVFAEDMFEPEQQLLSPEDITSKSWLDNSHGYISGSGDQLANWIDQFFGVPGADLESARSQLRLNIEYRQEEGDGNTEKVQLRGKVRLPRINKRLSLVFTDENEETGELDRGITSIDDDEQNTEVGLSYNIMEHISSRLDLKAGLRSSGHMKLKARYRYELPVGDKYINRFTETLYFLDPEGFGFQSTYDLNRIIDENRLVRWSNNARITEDIQGVEWSTRLLLGRRIDEKSAISYFVWTGGETRPDYLTTSYGLGMRYRRKIIRPWIFYELEPAYAWQRELVEDDRDGVFIVKLRLGIIFEKFDEL